MLALVYAILAIPIGFFILGYIVVGLIGLGIADSTAITIGIIFWILFIPLAFIVGWKQEKS